MATARLEQAAVETWQASHPGWRVEADALLKRFSFKDYPSTLAFVMRLAFVAEARGHHPDLVVRYGAVEVSWTTHDAGGLTDLDLAQAERTDELLAP